MTPYNIVLDRPWRYRDARRGAQVMPAGRYRVPEQVPEAIAARAVGEGMAKREARFGETFATPGGAQNAYRAAGDLLPRRRTRKSRRGAPENKMLPGAPEDR
jgi:hypothetical protein